MVTFNKVRASRRTNMSKPTQRVRLYKQLLKRGPAHFMVPDPGQFTRSLFNRLRRRRGSFGDLESRVNNKTQVILQTHCRSCSTIISSPHLFLLQRRLLIFFLNSTTSGYRREKGGCQWFLINVAEEKRSVRGPTYAQTETHTHIHTYTHRRKYEYIIYEHRRSVFEQCLNRIWGRRLPSYGQVPNCILRPPCLVFP